MSEKQNSDGAIQLFIKTMKSEYVEDTLKRGRFCFNHPSAFNKWENRDAAQWDKWDAHSAYEATHMIYAPIVGEVDGKPVYGEVKKFADKGIVREQSQAVAHTPICCFRIVGQSEYELVSGGINISLGDVADRIAREFGHDSFVLVWAAPLVERMRKNGVCFSGSIIYEDVLNNYQFDVPERYSEIVEQLFRKDCRFEWQKEYRFTLRPTENSPIFVELGSIEDIAIGGKISDLR